MIINNIIVPLQIFTENPATGAGTGTSANYMIEIGIMLFVAFLLGILFQRMIFIPVKKDVKRLREKLNEKEADDVGKLKEQRTVTALETRIAQLEQRNNDLRILLTASESETVKMEALKMKNADLENQIAQLLSNINKPETSSVKLNTPNYPEVEPNAPTAPEPEQESSVEEGIRLGTGKNNPVNDPYDLKQIEGIGPKIHEILSNAGINTFDELAMKTAEELSDILLKHGNQYKIHNPTTWPEQAALARDGKWDELRIWQSSLKGGKEPEK